jgi:hypothetical protein
MTLEYHLAAVVALLPPGEKARFTAPLSLDESADSRLIDAVRSLAKVEGLVCMSPSEFSRATVAQHSMLTTAASPPDMPANTGAAALPTQFATITDPAAQTAFWRSLTPEQRVAILNAQ